MITTEVRNNFPTCTATTSSSSLTSSSLNFPIPREQRQKGDDTGFQRNMKNKQVTCSPSFNSSIYASLSCKHPLGTQEYKRQGVGSSSSIFWVQHHFSPFRSAVEDLGKRLRTRKKGSMRRLDIIKKNSLQATLNCVECLRNSKGLATSFHSLLSRYLFCD